MHNVKFDVLLINFTTIITKACMKCGLYFNFTEFAGLVCSSAVNDFLRGLIRGLHKTDTL